MNTRRVAKAAEAIRESVSMTILLGLRDPRVKNVTVLRAEVSGDLRAAKVYVSVMGDAKTQSLTMHGLESARGFIQAKVADRLQTKNTPVLKFVLDPGVKYSAETSQTLREVMPESSTVSDDVETDDSEFDNDIDDVDDGEVDDGEVDDESVSGSAGTR
ncbi:MAG: 30S ribosome-binding factor RbfA [Schlesneria sp.]